MVVCMMKNAKIARRNLAREVDKTLKSDIIKGKECLKFNIVEEFKMKVLVETSARHLHLSQEHLEILF